nr:dynein assembly factor 5, axonemal [Onthophagus taurus]
MTLQEENTSTQAILHKFCSSLQSEDRKIRKKAFEDINVFVSNLKPENPEEFHKIFNEINIHMLNGLRDKSEPVREESIKFLTAFIITILPKNDYYLSYIFPVLTERLATCEIIEESEEVRLQLITFLEQIIDKYEEKNQLKPFLNDIVAVLRETVKDKYPSIKEKSCHCIVKLTRALPRDFHYQAESLIKPVLSNFSHQRFKIRCEAIKTIGEIILFSTYKGFDEITGPMAERLFDQIPIVRRTVAQVAAKWLLEYRDRYSFFHKLLPLILTGLNDEVPETREEAAQLWAVVGMQYQNENENDLKEEMDFLIEPPKYYLQNVERPNLGCRTIVKRNISKMAKAMSNELASWQLDVRIRVGQLLVSVVLHAEEGITHNMQDLLPAMYMAVRNDDVKVTENVIKASEIIGIFVPVNTWKKIILPAIEDGVHNGHLAILAGLIRGSPIQNIEGYIDEISQLLADKTICQSRKKKQQREMINCANALMEKYVPNESFHFGQNIFNILVTTIALRDVENVDIDIHLLEKLQKTLGFATKYELWSKFCGNLLDEIKKDPKVWTVVTAERCIFEIILLESEEAFGENLKLIGDILIDALHLDSDVESRLKTFVALTKAMDSKNIIFKHSKDDLNSFLEVLVIEVLVPSLVWHAGRTSEAMRTMAASCLFSALNPNDDVEIFCDQEVFRPLFDKLTPLLISLSQDSNFRSRQLAIQDLALLKETAQRRNCWKIDDFVKIYPEVIKRLDDPTDKVRLSCVQCLGVIFEDVPDEFLRVTYRSHHNYIIDTLMVHFDDEDGDFQDLIGVLLKSLAVVCGKALKGKLEKQMGLFRNRKGCEEILESLRGMDLNENDDD